LPGGEEKRKGGIGGKGTFEGGERRLKDKFLRRGVVGYGGGHKGDWGFTSIKRRGEKELILNKDQVSDKCR